jgi:hypothetical protein
MGSMGGATARAVRPGVQAVGGFVSGFADANAAARVGHRHGELPILERAEQRRSRQLRRDVSGDRPAERPPRAMLGRQVAPRQRCRDEAPRASLQNTTS